jgi:hypothetical protein
MNQVLVKYLDFYPKHLNHAFMPKPDFEGYRNDVKKSYEEEQYPSGREEHQMPDHPVTFMKMIKGRSQALSAANDERRQVLPSRVIWDGSIDRFELYRISWKVIMGKLVQVIYLIRNFRLLT